MATDQQTDPLKAFAEGLNLDAAVRAGPDGAPLLDEADGEELAASFTDVEAAVGTGGAVSLGKGTVYVTTRRVVWLPAAAAAAGGAAARGLALRYPQIVMHAVSAGEGEGVGVGQRPCVYLQLDDGDADGDGDGGGGGIAAFAAMAAGGGGGSGGNGAAAHNDDGDDDEGADGSGSGDEDEGGGGLGAELRLAPADAGAVEAIFKAMCDCSALNPDSDMEEEGGAELFFDEAAAIAGLPAEARDALLAARAGGALGVRDGVDALMEEEPDRFGDEDEDEDEGEEEEEAGAAAAVGAQNGR